VKISQNFTTLLKASFRTVSIFVNIHLPPFNKSMHSCPVTVLLLPLQILEHGVMQCLFICVMVSSQAVFQTNKRGKSDGGRSGRQGWMWQDCSSKFSDGLNRANTSVAWHSYGEATTLTFFLWDNSPKMSIQTSYLLLQCSVQRITPFSPQRTVATIFSVDGAPFISNSLEMQCGAIPFIATLIQVHSPSQFVTGSPHLLHHIRPKDHFPCVFCVHLSAFVAPNKHRPWNSQALQNFNYTAFTAEQGRAQFICQYVTVTTYIILSTAI
jgi:hypothetical protein